MLEVTPHLRIPSREFRFRFAASGGPGGQNVNKRSTKALLEWDVAASPSISEAMRERIRSRYATRITRDGRLLVTSERHRDQAMNREDCLRKLAEMLRAVARPPRPRRATKPARSAVEKRLEAKRKRGRTKQRRAAPDPAEW